MRRSVRLAAEAVAGLAAVGVAGGIVAPRVAARRLRRRDDWAADDDLGLPDGVTHQDVTMSDGAVVHVLTAGAADAERTFLLVHGLACSAAIWRYQLESLPAAGCRVVALDQRGHGRSTVGTEGLTLHRLAADVAEVAEQLHLSGAVLVGHSMGGMVALRLLGADRVAAGGGGRFGGLALVATSSNPAVGSGVPGAGAVVVAAAPLLARSRRLVGLLPGPSLTRGDLSYMLARLTFGSDPSPSQVELTRNVTADVPLKVLAELLLEIVEFDESAAMEAIKLPASVVVGTRDVMTPIRHAEAMAEAIGGTELVVLEGCGHMVMLERHEDLDATLIALGERVGTPVDENGGSRWFSRRRNRTGTGGRPAALR